MKLMNKQQIARIINENRGLKIVDSPKTVKEYYDQKVYAIEKDSPILKELLDEGVLPYEHEISQLKKGCYYIIDH